MVAEALSLTAAAQTPRVRAAVENMLIDAVSLLDEGQVAGARSLLGVLRKEDPGNDAVLYYLGLCDLREGKLDDAEKNISDAAGLDPSNLWYRETLASVLAAKGDADKAVDIYAQLLEKDPRQFSTPYVLAMIGDRELGARRDSAALGYYERSLELDPGYAPAVLGKAEVYRIRGNLPQFFVCMDEFVRNEEVLPQARAHYLDNLLRHVDARLYRGWGAQLDSLVEAGARTAPRDSSMLKLAGQWYYGTGRKDRGREYFSRLLEAWPRDMSARIINIQLLSESGEYGKILQECREMLTWAEGRDRITVLTVLGDTCHQTGDKKGAYRAYEEVLKLDPGYAPVLNNYAYYLCLEGKKLRKAEKMSRTTIEKEPDNPTYLDTYGWILHLLGRDAEAKVYLKRAIVYGASDNAVILGHYAAVLRALGEENAAAYYEGQAERKKK